MFRVKPNGPENLDLFSWTPKDNSAPNNQICSVDEERCYSAPDAEF